MDKSDLTAEQRRRAEALAKLHATSQHRSFRYLREHGWGLGERSFVALWCVEHIVLADLRDEAMTLQRLSLLAEGYLPLAAINRGLVSLREVGMVVVDRSPGDRRLRLLRPTSALYHSYLDRVDEGVAAFKAICDQLEG